MILLSQFSKSFLPNRRIPTENISIAPKKRKLSLSHLPIPSSFLLNSTYTPFSHFQTVTKMFSMNNIMCTKIGGVLCPQPPVYLINQQTSYNNPQISQKMKYAQYIRIQSKTYGGPNSNDTTSS